jgi:hypothetical protein
VPAAKAWPVAGEVRSHAVQEAGRSGVSNGKLLARVAGQFDAFITIDQNLSAQQDTAALSFGIIVLRSRTNQLHALAPLAPQILSALPMLLPGRVLVIGSPG